MVIFGVELDKPASVEVFIAEDPEPCYLTFFDTLNSNMAGHESDTLDMSNVVKGCDHIRRRLQTVVVVVRIAPATATTDRRAFRSTSSTRCASMYAFAQSSKVILVVARSARRWSTGSML
jgi:hypothetical protein